MLIDHNKLPKKLNEVNYFKKEEQGATLYSFEQTSKEVIVVSFKEMEIQEDFCVNANALEMVGILSPCEIEIKDDNFVIKSKKGIYKSALLDSPLITLNQNYTNEITVDLDRLKIASKFCDTKATNTKISLKGVCVDSNGNIYASDAYIAYRYLNPDPKENDNASQIVIPSSLIDFIYKTMRNIENKLVTIKYNQRNCLVDFGDTKIISALIDSAFPDLNRTFSKYVDGYVLELDTKDFKDKISIAEKVGKIEESQIVLSNDKMLAEGTSNYKCVLNANNEVEYQVRLSLKNLSTVMGFVNEEKTKLIYSDSLKPLVVKDSGVDYLILPIRKS